MIDISVRNVHRPLKDSVVSSQLFDATGLEESALLTEEPAKQQDISLPLTSGNILEAVKYVADAETVALPLAPTNPSVKKQKPASH